MSTPIDGKVEEPKQTTVKVAPCIGCGKLPHGSVNERIHCLEREVIRLRALLAGK